MLLSQPTTALASRTAVHYRPRLVPKNQVQLSNLVRCLATSTATLKRYDAVVIGAGPGGLTCVTNLLDQGLQNVCMVDPSFTAGRINEKYREVPSNTKTMMFEKWATGTKVAEQILKSAPKPNAYERLLTFNQDAGCPLGDAIDVAQLLSDGLRKDPRVHSIETRVKSINKLDDNTWRIPELDLLTNRVVLAVGSHPKPHDLASHYPHIKPLDLDTCLKPSDLAKAVPEGSKVGVVGASHSAILAIKNLYDLGNVEVINFHRSPLLYAIYKEGWILYDNTGLKGIAADWAREVLGALTPPKTLRRINMKSEENQGKSEKEIYDKELQGVTHLVSAIGYEMNQLPTITVNGKTVQPEFDPLTGRFFSAKENKEVLGGLFGAGIAYPERVTDPAGNVESAVGWFKFMKFVKRTSPEWVQKP
ncbi:Putative uncharacterized protein [Taphrina deformans PYCC 5710]|uniref:FAD/NAD(P)-binding domain-containing protein n=1 Tax=Taphrina deformans (strain PYCC 5710 / ATCC 11124 / CBS 356.35 / IMI 108563 / JCM 9778 / NBRC 8474) TaxID=1097556 RepID=R4X9L4_TAPDE|nr:Putative uncharacterized protein [Taphrina deformans PYCC 5710]|eukprot:CCG82105.1 Putative uncharacterized protein [Taphrina deformans PYCC 5710]